MIRIPLALLCASLSFSLVSCGPEKSADEALMEQEDTKTKLKKAELEKIADRRRPNIERAVGEFKGSYTFEGNRVNLLLSLFYVEVEHLIPNSGESVFLPELRGSVRTESRNSTTLSYSRFEPNDDASWISLTTPDQSNGINVKIETDGDLSGRFFTRNGVDSVIVFTRQ